MSESDKNVQYKPAKVEKKQTKKTLEIEINTNNVYLDGDFANARKPTYTQGGDVWIPLSTLSILFPHCEKNGKIKLEVNNG